MEIPQPKYKFGQPVKVTIETEDRKTGLSFKNEVSMYIKTITIESTESGTRYSYGLTVDMPAAYHGGKEVSVRLNEKDIIPKNL